MKRLDERTLERAKVPDLKRLARWLRVLPNSVARNEGTFFQQRRALICAIMRKEKWLARLPKDKQHEIPG